MHIGTGHFRRLAALLAVCLAQPCLALDAADGFGRYAPPQKYSEQVSSSLYLPMRDGVALAVRVTRPAVRGQPVATPLPVIWQHGLSIAQDPPRIAAADSAFWSVPSLTAYGYVIVQVARRGNGQSYGSRRGYNDRTEADDAYEVTEWLASQPWSSGVIGVYGCSNTGDAAMHAVSARPPHLKAAFAGCFSWSKFDAMRRGGIFAQWGTGPSRTLDEDMKNEPVDGDGDKFRLRQAAEEHQLSTDLYAMWKELPYRDSWSSRVASRFWSEGSISSYADQLRHSGVAVYVEGGWFDELRDQGIVALLNLPNSHIVIGPWKHCQNPGFDLLHEMLRFFDQMLKGIDTGIVSGPRIHYYAMAGADSEWRASEAWPPAGSDLSRHYLGAGQTLSKGPAKSAWHADFTVDTHVNCPDGGMGPFMQPCHNAAQGVLFASAPLKVNTEVTGSGVVHLFVTSDKGDGNLFAYLEDVSPNGEVHVVTEGRLKISLRKTSLPPFKVPGTPWHRGFAEDRQSLRPGDAAELSFELLPTSYLFKPGHRLQITITGADFRERDRDPALDNARISVRGDASRESYVEIPIKMHASS